MADMAVEDGITHVICTPHASHRYPFQPSENAIRLARLREELEHRGNPLILGQGCDFHLTWDNLEDAKAHPGKYSLNGKQYLLVELPDNFIPMGLTDTFAELQMSGTVPIVTHPERNSAIQRNPERMKPWLENGALVQVTAGSVVGRFGSKAQTLAQQFLADDWVHLIATDAHSTSGRPPRMREAFDLIEQTFGAGTAQRLCEVNPKAVFEGVTLAPQPYPRGISEDDVQPRSRSWLKRLLGNK
jgi:protein-tyrosine phosphatase